MPKTEQKTLDQVVMDLYYQAQEAEKEFNKLPAPPYFTHYIKNNESKRWQQIRAIVFKDVMTAITYSTYRLIKARIAHLQTTGTLTKARLLDSLNSLLTITEETDLDFFNAPTGFSNIFQRVAEYERYMRLIHNAINIVQQVVEHDSPLLPYVYVLHLKQIFAQIENTGIYNKQLPIPKAYSKTLGTCHNCQYNSIIKEITLDFDNARFSFVEETLQIYQHKIAMLLNWDVTANYADNGKLLDFAVGCLKIPKAVLRTLAGFVIDHNIRQIITLAFTATSSDHVSLQGTEHYCTFTVKNSEYATAKHVDSLTWAQLYTLFSYYAPEMLENN